VRGGNYKFRALRLDHGNFSWGTEVRQQQQQPATHCSVGLQPAAYCSWPSPTAFEQHTEQLGRQLLAQWVVSQLSASAAVALWLD
jgi:hypothetical protein